MWRAGGGRGVELDKILTIARIILLENGRLPIKSANDGFAH